MASETLPSPTHKATLQLTHLFPIFIKRSAISNNFTPSHPISCHSSACIHPSLFLPAFPNLLSFVTIGLKSSPRLKWLLSSEPSGVLSFIWLVSHTQQTLSHDLSSCVLSRSLTFKGSPLLLCPAFWVPYRSLIHILSFFWSILPSPCTKQSLKNTGLN